MKNIIILIMFLSQLGLAKEYATGLIPVLRDPDQVNKTYLLADVKVKGNYRLWDTYKNLTGIFDQKRCGSCVYNSVVKNFQDSLIIRKQLVPVLSREHLMNCGNGYQCNGYWFDGAAKDLVSLDGLASEASYPYTASSGGCNDVTTKHGPIKSYQIIANNPKSIMTALSQGYPVSVTVGADGSLMNYDGSEVYTSCTHTRTNHEVLIYGWDCETSLNPDGSCKFDSQGSLPPGVGYWYMVNSWGEKWAAKGIGRIKITDESGSLCNNLGEEAGILETGIPVVPPIRDFTMDAKTLTIKVHLANDYTTVDEAQRILQPFLTALDNTRK